MCWYATTLAALVGAWSTLIDRYTFHASIHEENEVIFLGLDVW